VASKVISAADTNGDGSLSLGEIETAIGADTTSSSSADALSQAFASIDTNGDGQVSADELTNALDAQNASKSAQAGGPQGAHHHHHAHGSGGPPSSTDLASQLLGSADTDGDGELSLSEMEAALGLSSTSTTGSASASTAATTAATATADANSILTSAMTKWDANGDGKLSVSELSTGIQAFLDTHNRGAASSQSAQTVTA
jgi:Ca2+-binding EF-hand superfamily protein